MIAKWRVYMWGRDGKQKNYGFVIALANNTYWAEGRDSRVAIDVYERWNAETQTWVRHPFYTEGDDK